MNNSISRSLILPLEVINKCKPKKFFIDREDLKLTQPVNDYLYFGCPYCNDGLELYMHEKPYVKRCRGCYEIFEIYYIADENMYFIECLKEK